MSNRLFRVSCPVERTVPRRVPRSWRRTVLDVLVLLALLLLVAWLCRCVGAAAGASGGQRLGAGGYVVATLDLRPLIAAAVEHWWGWLAAAGLLAVLVGLAEWQQRRQAAFELELAAYVRRIRGGGARGVGPAEAGTTNAEGVPAEDVGRILRACAEESRAVVELVRRAAVAMSEDYYGSLQQAERKTAAVILCIENLLVRLDADPDRLKAGLRTRQPDGEVVS